MSDNMEHSFCEKLVKKHLNESPIVLFLLDALKQAGCPYGATSFICVPCKDIHGGGFFQPNQPIKICEDAIQSTHHVQDTLTHELLHAFDHCRVTDLGGCRQQACSEIRAANLSGDCKWSREIMRGNWRIAGQHKRCVERRAKLSLTENEACRECDIEKVIKEVWKSCYNDTAPFIDVS